MSVFVLDTDTLSLLQRGHPGVTRRCASRAPGELAISAISVEEQVSGWYTMLRRAKNPEELAIAYQSLVDTVRFLAGLPILSFSPAANARFQLLLGQKLNVGGMDLKIAAIVLETGGVVVSRNLRDFRRIPSLVVEDWSV
jgi:tRNA(fMet)-specific endonuclease VapC